MQSLMRLIETQSKATIDGWCVSYAEKHFLPIYEKSFPEDARPTAALNAARDWLDGKVKLPAVKKLIWSTAGSLKFSNTETGFA